MGLSDFLGKVMSSMLCVRHVYVMRRRHAWLPSLVVALVAWAALVLLVVEEEEWAARLLPPVEAGAGEEGAAVVLPPRVALVV